MQWGVPQPWSLQTYLDLYISDSTCAAVINALVSLTLSEITVSSEAPEGIDRAVLEFNRRIGLHNCLDTLLTDYYLYGACYAELVLTETGNDILGLTRIDPRTVRVKVNRYGRITAYLQLPWLVPNTLLPVAGQPISLEPTNIISIVRKPIRTHYGLPVLESCKTDVKSRGALGELSFRSAKALSFPTPVHSLQPDPEGIWTKEDYEEVMVADQAAWKDLQPGDHVHRVGTWQDAVFAPSDHLQPVGEEIENFNSQVISAAGLNANAVGLNYSKGWTPSTVQTKLMVNQLRATQLLLMEALNRILFRRYADTYNTPDIYCEMAMPILESDKEKWEGYATLLNNADRLFRMGVIDEDTMAQLLGYDSLADVERLREYIEQNQTPQSPTDQSGDRNQQQRNKSELDRRDNNE